MIARHSSSNLALSADPSSKLYNALINMVSLMPIVLVLNIVQMSKSNKKRQNETMGVR